MRRLICCAAAVLTGGAAVVGTGPAKELPDRAPALGRLPDQFQIRNRDIAFYQARVTRDPRSARDFTQLAGLYLQRARETADNGDLVRAEQTARHSLELRTARNGAAFGILGSSLLAQHRFVEALAAATSLVALDSTSVSARGLLAETQLELGLYQDAGRTLATLATYRTDLSVAPRLARWEELHGRPEQARRLLRSARDQAARRHGMPREQLAWLHLRLGDLALRHGHLREAESELRTGLGIAPDDYRLWATKARLDLVRHRWREAIASGETAIGRALDPATIGVVGEAYSALGDSGRAAEYYRAMELAVLRQPGPFHRGWSLFLLDHDREIPTVLSRVMEELQTRRDIYGYDLLAWALYKSGRSSGAKEAVRNALALGTRDAVLLFHAGMIALRLGERDEARRYLQAALKTNPAWHPFQPDEARAVLRSLGSR